MTEAPLFDAARHEPLAGGPWDEAAARAAIARIAARCLSECDPQQGWRLHPQDDPDFEGQCAWPLYHGAAGVVWALWQLARDGALSPEAAGFAVCTGADTAASGAAGPGGLLRPRADAPFAGLVPQLAQRAGDDLRAAAGHRHGSASLLLGEVGCWLLQWQLGGGDALLDDIAAAVAANARNPCWEQLWGGSGTVLAAIAMAERCPQDGRWADLVRDGVAALAAAREADPATGTPIWQQQLYGRSLRLLGAGHGLAGNVYPALRGAAWLPPAGVADLLDGALATLLATAQRGIAPASADAVPLAGPGERPLLNWLPDAGADAATAKRLVQDCHGAPGIVVRLADAPRTPAWDALLAGAAELTWQAGPLAKGAGLCHGTAGNGFALLKLWRRSGDPLWLHRARAFGMHAIAQVEAAAARHGHGRPSLWTGDPGVALYLWQCVSGGDRFPTLDVL